MTESDSASLSTDLPQAAPLLSTDIRSWIVTFVATVMSYLIVSHGLFSPLLAEWQIALFVGVVAALAAETVAQGGIIGTVVVGAALLAIAPDLGGHRAVGPLDWLLAVALADLAAFGVGLLLSHSRRRERLALVVSAVMVVWVLANLWAPLFAHGLAMSGYGPLKASVINEVPKAGEYVNDDALYRRVFYLMHDGVPYYQAYKQAWLGLKLKPPLPNAVTAYRLPTMYWLWRALPPHAFLIEIVFLAFVSVGCVAAASITGQLVGARFAPLAPAALAAFALASAISVYMTYVDLPSASVALVGVALFVRALSVDDRRYLWAAAGVVTLAALTREILAYLIVFAALSALFAPAGRRWRALTPWLAALGVFALGYAAHALAVLSVMHATSSTLSYVGGSPAFALDATRRFSNTLQGGGVLLPTLFVLGVLGAWAASKRVGRQFAIFAVPALVVPILAMMKLGNPAIDAAGHQINYWGNLVVPLALALWPVSALLLPELAPVESAEPSPSSDE